MSMLYYLSWRYFKILTYTAFQIMLVTDEGKESSPCYMSEFWLFIYVTNQEYQTYLTEEITTYTGSLISTRQNLSMSLVFKSINYVKTIISTCLSYFILLNLILCFHHCSVHTCFELQVIMGQYINFSTIFNLQNIWCFYLTTIILYTISCFFN